MILTLSFVGLFLQFADGFLEGSNLALGVSLFLAFQFNYLSRSILHETFVGKFLLDACQEALQTLDFRFSFLDFSLSINQVAQRNCVLISSDEEG